MHLNTPANLSMISRIISNTPNLLYETSIGEERNSGRPCQSLIRSKSSGAESGLKRYNCCTSMPRFEGLHVVGMKTGT